MAKSFHQKMKILYLMQAFQERTDEQHPMTVKDMMEYLAEFGISVDRKTVYDDIEALRLFGMDIENRREKPSGFYLASREFELPELRILVDAVQSSHFITSRKSMELIRKLEKLTSVHYAKQLQSQVSTGSRVKAANESIYYNVDAIHEAIAQDKQISFQYYEWTLLKEMQLRRNGERYHVSPWELIWKDENYYLIGVDEKNGIVKHYRVDKMRRMNIENAVRNGKELFQNFDTMKFASGTFGMFGGKETTVQLDFENRFAGVVIDRFGQEVLIHRKDEDHFTTFVRVNVSCQFFGWLAGLGSGAKIVSPESARKEYKEFLQKALSAYI